MTWRPWRRSTILGNEAFLQPMLEGHYPDELLRVTAQVTDWAFVQDGDLELINVPLSILGVNYYSSSRARKYDGTGERQEADGHGDGEFSPWVGADDVEFIQQPGPYTSMGWNIDPDAFTELLLGVGRRYPATPLMITENGAAFYDVVSDDGRVHDDNRVDYLYPHLDAVGRRHRRRCGRAGLLRLVTAGQLRVGLGLRPRFGIIRVDFDTLERTLKDSAHWYAEAIRTNALPDRDLASR